MADSPGPQACPPPSTPDTQLEACPTDDRCYRVIPRERVERQQRDGPWTTTLPSPTTNAGDSRRAAMTDAASIGPEASSRSSADPPSLHVHCGRDGDRWRTRPHRSAALAEGRGARPDPAKVRWSDVVGQTRTSLPIVVLVLVALPPVQPASPIDEAEPGWPLAIGGALVLAVAVGLSSVPLSGDTAPVRVRRWSSSSVIVWIASLIVASTKQGAHPDRPASPPIPAPTEPVTRPLSSFPPPDPQRRRG